MWCLREFLQTYPILGNMISQECLDWISSYLTRMSVWSDSILVVKVQGHYDLLNKFIVRTLVIHNNYYYYYNPTSTTVYRNGLAIKSVCKICRQSVPIKMGNITDLYHFLKRENSSNHTIILTQANLFCFVIADLAADKVCCFTYFFYHAIYTNILQTKPFAKLTINIMLF